MKKLAYLMSFCLVFFGMVTFAGCGGSNEIEKITISQLPNTIYSYGDSLNVNGGKFTVNYKNGSTREFDLAFASRNVNKLTQAGLVDVVISYKGFTDTFRVRVNQKDYTPNYNAIYSNVYNAQPQAAIVVDEAMLLEGMTIFKTEYKIFNGSDDTYTTVVPTDAGHYTVRTTINGGENYQNKTLYTSYTIKKANYRNFSTNGNFIFKDILNYDYQQDFDLSKQWVLDNNGTTGVAPFNDEIATNISYYYQKAGTTEKVKFVSDNGKIFANLDAGNYDIFVEGQETDNLAPFSMKSNLNIKPKTLVYGEDFYLKIKEGKKTSSYIPTENYEINTVIKSDFNNPISVELEFSSEMKEFCSITGTKYRATNPAGQISTQINSAGTYIITFDFKCTNKNYVLPDAYYAIIVQDKLA